MGVVPAKTVKVKSIPLVLLGTDHLIFMEGGRGREDFQDQILKEKIFRTRVNAILSKWLKMCDKSQGTSVPISPDIGTLTPVFSPLTHVWVALSCS